MGIILLMQISDNCMAFICNLAASRVWVIVYILNSNIDDNSLMELPRKVSSDYTPP